MADIPDTRTIPLTQGRVAIVDAADYDAIAAHKWYAHRQYGDVFYAGRSLPVGNGKFATLHMHRLIMAAPKGLVVDHINHNGLDNRRSNLRLCTNLENVRHCSSAKGATSKYLGVGWHKSTAKWMARIRFGGKQVHLGTFIDEAAAARAYDEAAHKHYGTFANLNFKD